MLRVFIAAILSLSIANAQILTIRRKPITSSSVAGFTIKSGATNATRQASPATVSLTGVSAGDLVIVWVDGATTAAITCTDGNSTDNTNFAYGTQITDGGASSEGQFCYLLSSAASGSVTYTATISGGTDIDITAVDVSYDAGLPVSLDTQNTHTGTETTSTSGTINRSGTYGLVVGGWSSKFGAGTASPTSQINGSTAAQTFVTPSPFQSYVNVSAYSANWTGGAATFSNGGSLPYVAAIIAFKQ